MNETTPLDALTADALTTDALLRAYDDQVRDVAEVSNALHWERIGPVIAATYGGGRGFITYRALTPDSHAPDASGVTGQPLDAAGVAALVHRVLAHFTADPQITHVEWKSRGHDIAPGLHEALTSAGFVPGEPESIMIGEARLLAADLPLPDGVTARQVITEDDVRRTCAMQAEVFGYGTEAMADEVVARVCSSDADTQLWIAEHEGDVISAGRLEPVPGTLFAGIWGGCTRPPWRGRGIYRVLTAARARSALALGKQLINSDSTEFSRPILERSGLVKVGVTTPYEWTRA